MRNVNIVNEPKTDSGLQPEALALLKAKKEYPSVSFLLPVNKQYPKVREEEKKLKAMVKKAEEKMEKELSAKMAASISEKLRKLTATLDFSHLSQSLAVFVSPVVQKVVHLTFPVEEKMIIGRTFELRDLLFAAKNSFHYIVLAISENKVRLFFGYNYSLAEVQQDDFPNGIIDTGGKGSSRTQSFSSFASSKHVSDLFDHREKQVEKYLYDIDNILSKILKEKKIPLVICGDRKVADKFRAISKNSSRIIGNADGNFDQTSEHNILAKIEPLLRGKLKTSVENTMALLEDAVSKRMCASGITEVWKAVMEKRGRLLVVEKDYRCPGKIGNNKFTLITTDLKENGSHLIPDAVDDIIEFVLLYGGEVVFVENGALPLHQRIALITYYA